MKLRWCKPGRPEPSRGPLFALASPLGALTLNHIVLMVEAAANGLGIAYMPHRSAQRWIKRGALAVALDEWCPWIPGLFLYYPSYRYVPLGLRDFVDGLKTE